MRAIIYNRSVPILAVIIFPCAVGPSTLQWTKQCLNTESGEASPSSEAVVASLLKMFFFLTIFVLVVPVTSASPTLPIMVIHPETDGRGSEGVFENSVKVKQWCPLIPHPLLTRNIKHHDIHLQSLGLQAWHWPHQLGEGWGVWKHMCHSSLSISMEEQRKTQ